MNGKLWVIIDGRESGVRAQLAGEALKRAAREAGAGIEVVLGDGKGVGVSFGGEPKADDRLLLVGASDPPLLLAGLPRVETTLEQALADPLGLVNATPSLVKTGKAGRSGGEGKFIAAVTACPTGIAHTFLAAEGLRKAADALGCEIRVETQGAVGSGNPLTPDEIAAADVIVLATDRAVDRERFQGKPVYATGTRAAIADGRNLIKSALLEAERRLGTGSPDSADAAAARGSPYRHLMTGISYMLPFVMAGGLCLALASALGRFGANGSLVQALTMMGGKAGFALMVPALAGFISFSIANRPGIAPGMIGGMVCVLLGAGFWGGILAGYLAGYATEALNRTIPLPRSFASLKPTLILPLFGTLITGLLLYYVVGGPMASLNAFLVDWLQGMGSADSILVGVVMGVMTAIDLGGPVNKAAYVFALGAMESGHYLPMGASIVANMTPPLAAAFATTLFRSRYSAEEKGAGRVAFVSGLVLISEGAIPFAARDPLRAVPALIVGSAAAGGIAMALGLRIMAPHGGIFIVAAPGAISSLAAFFASLAAGVVSGGVVMGLLKRPPRA